MDKEIEKMKEAIMSAMEYRDNSDGIPNFEKTAENLVNAGYGNVNQAVKETLEKLRKSMLERAILRQDYFQVKSDLQTVIDDLIKGAL